MYSIYATSRDKIYASFMPCDFAYFINNKN